MFMSFATRYKKENYIFETITISITPWIVTLENKFILS